MTLRTFWSCSDTVSRKLPEVVVVGGGWFRLNHQGSREILLLAPRFYLSPLCHSNSMQREKSDDEKQKPTENRDDD